MGRPEKAVLVNDAFCAMTGYTARQAVALRPFVNVFVPEARVAVVEHLAKALVGENGARPVGYEAALLRHDGRRIPAALSADVALLDSRRQLVVAVRDLSGQRRAAAELESRARQQEAVAELGRQALVDRDLEALLEAAVSPSPCSL